MLLLEIEVMLHYVNVILVILKMDKDLVNNVIISVVLVPILPMYVINVLMILIEIVLEIVLVK